jgi:hypothetical protein
MRFLPRSLPLLFACLAVVASGCGGDAKRAAGEPREESRRVEIAPDPQAAPTAVPDTQPRGNNRLFALLVGVTKYDHMGKKRWLEGPGNDVKLMRRLLQDWSGFTTREIVCLSEEDAAHDRRLRPTRENIKREFATLAEKARRGDKVVILLAGHGSQQPDQPPYDEIDGLDEIFLPADVEKWNGEAKTVVNAIIDDELEVWLKVITDKKASVWITIDACHSGTMTREGRNPDEEVEIEREIRPEELGIPEKEIASARNRAREKAGKDGLREAGSVRKEAPFEVPTNGHLVAIYACRSSEPTVEMMLPREGRDRKRHGLLTFTMCQILMRRKSALTYKELVQQVQAQYDASGRIAPAPMVEGPDLDREVLGEPAARGRAASRRGRSDILLDRDRDDDSLMIRAGALHGLTENTTLAVYPLAGSENPNKLLGHVRITHLNYLDAKVTPCEYAGLPASGKLEPKGRCEVVSIDHGARRLKLAIAPRTAKALRTRAAKALAELARVKPGLVEVVASPAGADWLMLLEEEKVYLVSTELTPPQSGQPPSPFVKPAGGDRELVESLETLCTTIVRVKTLLALAESTEGGRAREPVLVDIEVEMIRYKDKSDKVGTVVPWVSGGRILKAGDSIAFRLKNHSSFAVDVTLLFIDPNYGIHAYFPTDSRTVENNRLEPGSRPLTTPRGTLDGDPPGRDRLVVIAVKAKGQPVDFSGLAQPTLMRAKARSTGKLESPLGQLLEGAFYGDRLRTSMTRGTIDSYAVNLLSWETRK